MTITSSRYVEPVLACNKKTPQAPPRIWYAIEPPFKEYESISSEDHAQGDAGTAIVIDNGSSLVRAGWSFDKTPRMSFPADVARYRDRKYNRTVSYVGYNAYADATTRGQIRNAFEPGTSIVGNWDVMEGVLDSIFANLGVEGESGGVGKPILMTEPIANLGYSRKTMTELLFECYHVPSLVYGIDSLFSYKFNKGTSGLIVSSSHSSTHVIPVLNSKPIMSSVSRLNWGGFQGAEYLLKLLRLKYPSFPGKVTDYQAQHAVREHCYVSQDFDKEMNDFLDWTDLEIRDHVIQYPFTEHVVLEKSEEELARIAERKREGGRRLQEQAARMRLEKLVQKEKELGYYKDLHQRLLGQTKKETKRLLDGHEFKDEAQLDRTIKDMEKSVRKARNKDLGVPDAVDEEDGANFPLLSIPDEELDEAGLRQKRHQRLLKSGVEARARAKVEKEQERARVAEKERLDDERRIRDLDGWLDDRRIARTILLQKIKDREKQKADLGNRKSLASQMRMKTLANLASDTPGRKRRRGGDDDNFGANDEDWGVYRTVVTGEQSEDEEEEDLDAEMKNVEAQLLKYDPGFTESNTMAAQMDWTKSLMHAFRRGPWPFDPESQREIHQLHLNVERIRVPEVVFQPAIAGLDQAGIIDIAADMINHGMGKPRDRNNILQDIFLTGGSTLFAGFEERLDKGLRAVLPIDTAMHLRQANDPLLDPWKGAAQWSTEPTFGQALVSRQDYDEKGSDYMKNQGPFDPYPQMKRRQALDFTSFVKRKTKGAVIQTTGIDAD